MSISDPRAHKETLRMKDLRHPALLPALSAVLVLSLGLLTASGGVFAADREAATPALTRALRVTLLLERSGEDPAADALRKGLSLAKEKAGDAVDTRVVAVEDELKEGEDLQEARARVFGEAASSSDLVIVGETPLHATLRSNAANFRGTRFGCVDTSVLGLRSANIMSVTFADNEAAFLAGAAAALMLADGQKLGWLEEESTPVRETMLAGFIAGAQVSKPDIRVVRRSLADTGRTPAELLSEMAADNARVVALAAGHATKEAYRALAQTNLYAVGVESDQSSLAPAKVPFSIVKRLDLAVAELVDLTRRGAFEGRRTLVHNLADGGVDLVFGKAFWEGAGREEKRAHARVMRRVQELRRELAAGNVVLQDKRTPTLCDCLD